MIFDFDGVTICDNTQEIERSDLFLLTEQNRKYLTMPPSNTVTPRELIERFALDSLKLVGVTGTNGKTTTTAAIYSMLNDLGYSAALQGTRGFFVQDRKLGQKGHTTPPILQTLFDIYRAKKEGAHYFVMEVSSHAIAQNRIEGLDFALKVLTNISQDHLDYHKTMEEYIRVKSSFFADEGAKLINKDEEKVTFNPRGARTYGVENMATYKVLAYSLEGGISAILQFGSESVDFHSPMLGLFNLYNLTAAIAATHYLCDLPLQRICEVAENFGGVKGRMEIVSYEPLVVVDFAHTPDGMQKVFESFAGKRIVALFGAGGDRDRSKRARMGEVASRYCTKIYLTSDNPRSEDPQTIIDDIAQGIRSGVLVRSILDRKEALKQAIAELERDEILLVLGKGDEEYIEIGDRQEPWSDVEVAQELLKQKE